MRLVDGDKVLVVELISMIDTPAGPELRPSLLIHTRGL
jgi:hypothetical protein